MKGANALLKHFVFWGPRQKSKWSEHTVSLGRITLTRWLLLSLLKRQGNLCCPGSYCYVNVAKNSNETAFPSSSRQGVVLVCVEKQLWCSLGVFSGDVCSQTGTPLLSCSVADGELQQAQQSARSVSLRMSWPC